VQLDFAVRVFDLAQTVGQARSGGVLRIIVSGRDPVGSVVGIGDGDIGRGDGAADGVTQRRAGGGAVVEGTVDLGPRTLD